MQNHCLIFLESPLVAQDLALTMKDLLGCGPIIATSLGEAEAQVAALPNGALIPCAFVHLSPSAFRPSRLHDMLRTHGAKVILVGHAAELEADAGDWPVLMQPFSSAQVADLIGRIAV